MLNYEFNKHMKSDKVKWVLTAIAFVLVAALIVGLFLQVFGEGKVKPSEWFNTQTEEQLPDDETPDDGGAVVETVGGNGVKLASSVIAAADYDEYGVSALAETAYTITATVTPADATNQNISWGVKFKNPSSSWASGKTVSDYVTISPDSTTKQLTVSCIKAFGEPIIITGTSVSNPEVSATCQVDYVKRVTSVKIGTVSGNDTATIKFSKSNTIYFTPTYSDGTLQGTIKYTSLKLSMNSAFTNYVKSHITGSSTSYTVNSSVTSPFTSFSGNAATCTFSLGTCASTFCSAQGNTDGIYPHFTNAFIKAINNYQGVNDHGSITATYTYTYDGETISSGTATTSKLWFSSEGMSVSVTGIDMDENIRF